MRRIYLAITGVGNVGRRLLELIERKRHLLQALYDLDLVVAGICDTSGGAMDQKGLNLPQVVSVKEQKKGVATLPEGIAGMSVLDLVERVQADILVELTLTNLTDGEPGLGAMRAAFAKKMHVVSANKGPLVLAYAELADLAKSNDVSMLHSATVTGGLPTLNIGMRDLGVATIHRVEGVFNGTTNYILTRMTQGEAYTDALEYAQDIGMAEADPTLDVDGWDAANKLVIIANAVLRHPTKLSDVDVQGIRGVTREQLKLAASQNQVIKLIATAQKTANGYEFSVRPTILDRSHPLAAVGANQMAVIYHTDINGKIFASIEEPDPYPTAAAVLRDIVHIATNR